jgi:hypothetical protein
LEKKKVCQEWIVCKDHQGTLSGLHINRNQCLGRRRDGAYVVCFCTQTSETWNPFLFEDTGISSLTPEGSPENPAKQGIMYTVKRVKLQKHTEVQCKMQTHLTETHADCTPKNIDISHFFFKYVFLQID